MCTFVVIINHGCINAQSDVIKRMLLESEYRKINSDGDATLIEAESKDTSVHVL